MDLNERPRGFGSDSPTGLGRARGSPHKRLFVLMILMFGTGYIQVLYLGRAPRTKKTLPDFRENCRVTRHSRVFRGLKGSQRTPGFWGVTIR